MIEERMYLPFLPMLVRTDIVSHKHDAERLLLNDKNLQGGESIMKEDPIISYETYQKTGKRTLS